MRSTNKARAVFAVLLTVVLATALTAPSGAQATPARADRILQEQPVQPSSHCGGYIASTLNYETETVTSFWVINTSLLFPPTCQQVAAAFCGAEPIGGNPTVDPGDMSTVTCPVGAQLQGGGFITSHVPEP